MNMSEEKSVIADGASLNIFHLPYIKLKILFFPTPKKKKLHHTHARYMLVYSYIYRSKLSEYDKIFSNSTRMCILRYVNRLYISLKHFVCMSLNNILPVLNITNIKY